MAESAENIENITVEPTSVMTGDRNQSRFLYYQLKMSMHYAKRIDLIVSFLMESGVRMLLNDLKAAIDRSVQIPDGEYSENRDQAVRKLKDQEIRVIFSVDMFNEGLDIASLDMVMFLRPTESPVDFAPGITQEQYRKMTDKEHLTKAKNMPIHFLKESGKGYFVEKEGYALAIRKEMGEVICKEVFRRHMRDILEYRVMEYYRRRYEK